MSSPSFTVYVIFYKYFLHSTLERLNKAERFKSAHTKWLFGLWQHSVYKLILIIVD